MSIRIPGRPLSPIKENETYNPTALISKDQLPPSNPHQAGINIFKIVKNMYKQLKLLSPMGAAVTLLSHFPEEFQTEFDFYEDLENKLYESKEPHPEWKMYKYLIDIASLLAKNNHVSEALQVIRSINAGTPKISAINACLEYFTSDYFCNDILDILMDIDGLENIENHHVLTPICFYFLRIKDFNKCIRLSNKINHKKDRDTLLLAIIKGLLEDNKIADSLEVLKLIQPPSIEVIIAFYNYYLKEADFEQALSYANKIKNDNMKTALIKKIEKTKDKQ